MLTDKNTVAAAAGPQDSQPACVVPANSPAPEWHCIPLATPAEQEPADLQPLVSIVDETGARYAVEPARPLPSIEGLDEEMEHASPESAVAREATTNSSRLAWAGQMVHSVLDVDSDDEGNPLINDLPRSASVYPRPPVCSPAPGQETPGGEGGPKEVIYRDLTPGYRGLARNQHASAWCTPAGGTGQFCYSPSLVIPPAAATAAGETVVETPRPVAGRFGLHN